MPPRLVFTLVRHGETNENRQRVLQGQIDTQLNDLGRRQAAAVAVALQGTRFQYAFASDLSRATAEAILKYQEDLALVQDKRLREKSFGDAEGLPGYTKVRGNAETYEQVRKRALSWWKEAVSLVLAENHSAGDSSAIEILVVSHGGLLRSLMDALVSGLHYSVDKDIPGRKFRPIPNTGVSVIETLAIAGGHIVRFGDASHLAGVSDSLNENVDEQKELETASAEASEAP